VRIRPGSGTSDDSLYGWEVNAHRNTLIDTGTEKGGGLLPASAPPVPTSGAGVFRFNRVYLPTSSSGELYKESIQSGIASFMEGINGTIFAYGSAGTMRSSPLDRPGITQLWFVLLVSLVKQLQERHIPCMAEEARKE
jgi:hypothetical protein